jgi:DNA-binding MarR family transcriptional regulator
MQAMDREELRREVLQDLRALSTADDFMNEAAAVVLGIHTTDMHAGEILDRVGPMTVGELARAVGLSAGAATALVDRLEEAGFASRVQDPGNRRRVIVRPSAGAADRAHAVFGPLIRSTATFLDRYDDHELLLIRDFLRGVRGIIAEHAGLLRGGDAGANSARKPTSPSRPTT